MEPTPPTDVPPPISDPAPIPPSISDSPPVAIAPAIADAPPADDALPIDPPLRPLIAQAPLSLILLAAEQAAADVADSVGVWKTHLATLDRPFELLLLRSGPVEVAADPLLADVVPITLDGG